MLLRRHVIGKMRVIIEYDQWGRLGNRMFQYAYSLILAKKYNCELLYNEGLPNFGIEPKPVNKLQSSVIRTRSIGNHNVDFNSFEDFDGDVIMDSYAQKSYYYTDHRELLKDAFGIRDLEPINSDSLVLHIRGTDYNQVNCFLGYDFYRTLINKTTFKKIKIVTDDPKCETVNKLVNEGCELVTDGPLLEFNVVGDRRAMEDFKTLLYSENIALSQSSFAWWAAFLGEHKKIILPYSSTREKQMWPLEPKKDEVDLFFNINNVIEKYVL